MPLTINRKQSNRQIKCLLHRTADIPGGVGVATSSLGGAILLEGTPIGKGDGNLYQVCKTAKVLAKAEASATTYEVAKGHHFLPGDYFATSDCAGQTIASIDKADPTKDVITLTASLGKVVKVGACAFEAKGNNKELKVSPIAVTGSDQAVGNKDNLSVSAWVLGVVRESNAPATSEEIRSSLKGIAYV